MDTTLDPVGMMDAGWQEISRKERLPFWRAFFEVYAIAVRHPERYTEFLDSIVKAWLPHLARSVVASGVPAKRAKLIATLIQAFLRGLILDLLTTGDYKRVEATYVMVREVLQRELKSARSS